MELSGRVYLAIAIAIAMLAMTIVSLREASLEAKLLPVVIGTVVFLLAIVELSSALMHRRKSGASVPEDELTEGSIARVSLRAYLVSYAWVIGFVLGIYLLGFVIAIPLMIVAYMRRHGATWVAGVATAILTVALLYSVFDLALRIGLYRGLVLDWLGG
ncbi:MAG: tripartite tricarboxylate transporter TctB family protein [Chloroflexi bacterium]|nr:tripartite tricarboxylate transporter TctB family protein [Chloroflexota bacterium]